MLKVVALLFLVTLILGPKKHEDSKVGMSMLKVLKPNPNLGVEGQAPLVLLPMTLWGEARGQSFAAKVCVAHVIINRSDKWGRSLKSIMLQRKQFSIFNENDPNRSKLLKAETLEGEKVWRECVAASWVALINREYDPTRGATHYYSGKRRPWWAKKMKKTLDLEPFHFFRES